MTICRMCYRELDEVSIQRNIAGELSDTCKTCYNIVGKGAGYADSMSKEYAEEWLEGLKERKLDLVKQGKL